MMILVLVPIEVEGCWGSNFDINYIKNFKREALIFIGGRDREIESKEQKTRGGG